MWSKTPFWALALSLCFSPFIANAQTILVDGTNYPPMSGTTISIGGSGTSNSAVIVRSGGRLLGADYWTLTTSGSYAHGVYVIGTSSFTGTNLNIETSGSGIYGANGVFAVNSSTISLVSSTITTGSNNSYGLGSSTNSTITGTNLYIETSGSNSHGAYAFNSSTISLVSSTITTGSTSSHGLYSNVGTITGTNLYIETSGESSRGAYAVNSSTISLVSSTIITGSNSSYGLYSYNTATITGTNLYIETSGSLSHGAMATISSTIALTGGTVITTHNSASGIYVANGSNSTSTVTATNTTFEVAGALVTATNSSTDNNNTVTLDNIKAANGTNVFNALGSGTNTLTVISSTLSGNLAAGNTSVNNVNLKTGSKLTGQSTHSNISQLNIALSTADTQWQVTGNSTLTNLTNSGTVNMSTGDNSRRTMTLNGNFTQQASGLIAMSLSGTGGLANSLVIVESTGSTAVAGGLNLLGDISAINNINNGHFVLFDDQGLTLVSGTFANIKLNGITVSLSTLAGTQNGGIFNVAGVDYVFTYAGIAETGAFTGGNDIMITLFNQPVPEPGAWAMMLSGTGILICYLRTRRRYMRAS